MKKWIFSKLNISRMRYSTLSRLLAMGIALILVFISTYSFPVAAEETDTLAPSIVVSKLVRENGEAFFHIIIEEKTFSAGGIYGSGISGIKEADISLNGENISGKSYYMWKNGTQDSVIKVSRIASSEIKRLTESNVIKGIAVDIPLNDVLCADDSNILINAVDFAGNEVLVKGSITRLISDCCAEESYLRRVVAAEYSESEYIFEQLVRDEIVGGYRVILSSEEKKQGCTVGSGMLVTDGREDVSGNDMPDPIDDAGDTMEVSDDDSRELQEALDDQNTSDTVEEISQDVPDNNPADTSKGDTSDATESSGDDDKTPTNCDTNNDNVSDTDDDAVSDIDDNTMDDTDDGTVGDVEDDIILDETDGQGEEYPGIGPALVLTKHNFMQNENGLLIGNAGAGFSAMTLDYEQPVFGVSRAEVLYCIYGGNTNTYTFENGLVSNCNIDSDYYGFVELYAEDAFGNISDIETYQVFVDATAPDIILTENEYADGSKSVEAVIWDNSQYGTGVADVRVLVDGQPITTAKQSILEVGENCWGSAVVLGVSVSAYVGEAGDHIVSVEAMDAVGNITTADTELHIENIMSEMHIEVPSKFDLAVAPWFEESVYSSPIEIKNESDYEVALVINGVTVTVNRDNAPDGIYKGVDLYLVRTDTGEEYPIKEGSGAGIITDMVLSPGNGQNTGSFYIRGSISDGSEEYWRSGDLNVKINFSYIPKKREE